MYFIFLWEVVKRAFTPAPRVTDMLQVAAASALPAATHFAGIRMPDGTDASVLAYIGLIAVSFVMIRVFWAPYAIWKEQSGTIGDLKLELTKPEILVQQHLAKARAKKRDDLIKNLDKMLSHGFMYNVNSIYMGAKNFNRAHVLVLNSGLDERLSEVLNLFYDASIFRFENKIDGEWRTDVEYLHGIYDYLSGRVTIEALLSRWPQGIELKTPQ